MTDDADDFDLHPTGDDRDAQHVGIASSIPSDVQPNPHDDILDQFPLEVVHPLQPEHSAGIDIPVEAPAATRPAGGVTWTLAVLLLGLAGGFGGGYLVGVRRPGGNPPATVAAVVAPALPSGSAVSVEPSGAAESTGSSGLAGSPREYTESTIADPVPTADRKAGENQDRRSRGEANAGTDANRARLQSDQSSAAGRLLVRSTPADAQVFVDDRDEGRTPATIRDLSLGAHRLRIVHEGYGVDEHVIVITPTEPARSLTVDLKESRNGTDPASRSSARSSSQSVDEARVGTLSVESRPSGARVLLDGKMVGTTPLIEARIGPGWHAILVERDGYRRWESSVSIEGGERNRITASLER